MNDTYDVAIVGAGPTGLTLANLLGRAGRRVVVIDRKPGTVDAPRAVSIDDEALRTMQAIDLADAVIADVALDYGSHYFTSSGVCFARVEPTTREYGFPRRNAFEQPKLEVTLRRGLDRFDGVTTLFGHECDAVAEHGDRVALTLRRLDDGATRTVEARYLVGCDGARSTIRGVIGATLGGETYRQPWLIVDLGATRERSRQTRVVCDPRRPFITLPGPGGIRRYEFMLAPDENAEAAEAEPFVRSLLAASGPDADMPIVRRQVYVFHARCADRWRRGRIFLAGDAAHLSPPFAGQGMNSGLRDAHNLAWKLDAVLAGTIGDGLLDTYRTERAPHAAALIDMAVRMGRVMMPTSRTRAFLTQTAFRLAGFVPPLQEYVAQMKYKPKPFYADGFLRRDGHGPSPVGRMLPQPIVEDAQRARTLLDPLLGDGFALLLVGAEAQERLAEAAALDFGLPVARRLSILPSRINVARDAAGADATHRDTADLVTRMIGIDRTAAVLVRPDRYVAALETATRLPSLAAAVRTLVADCRRTGAAPS